MREKEHKAPVIEQRLQYGQLRLALLTMKQGTWALPGGHLEHGESWAECSAREIKEETDLAVEFIGHVAVTNDIFESEQMHCITIFVVCRMKNPGAKPMVRTFQHVFLQAETETSSQNLEPHKCSWWAWKSWDDLKECPAKFIPLENLLRQYPDISSTVQKLIDSD